MNQPSTHQSGFFQTLLRIALLTFCYLQKQTITHCHLLKHIIKLPVYKSKYCCSNPFALYKPPTTGQTGFSTQTLPRIALITLRHLLKGSNHTLSQHKKAKHKITCLSKHQNIKTSKRQNIKRSNCADFPLGGKSLVLLLL